jgi:hypothetical protein
MGEDDDGGRPGVNAGGTGRWAATSHVSTDVVRSNLVPQLVRAGSALADRLGRERVGPGTGAVSSRQMHHVVMSGAGADLGALALEDFVELVDYDPVRHVALVVGRREAPGEAPLLWLLNRVFPAAQLVCVVQGDHGREPQPIDRAPRGSFEEALAVGRALKTTGGPSMAGPALAVLERVGLVLVVPPAQDMAAAIAAVLDAPR